MRRLLVALAALLLVLASAPIAALASDEDDALEASSSGSSVDSDDDDDLDDSGDTPDDSDGRDDDDDDEDDSGDTPDDSDGRVDDDDDDDDVADDDDGHHQRRHRRRHRNRGGDDDGGTAPPAGGGGGGGAPTGPAPTTGTVQIQDRSFAPSSVQVAVGGTVTWSNVSREHTVTADDGSFDSGVIDAGVNFDHTFPAAGTFDYKCLIHPEMVGTVTVGDAPSGASSGSEGSGAATSGSSASVGDASSSGSVSSAGVAGSSGLPAIASGAIPAPLTAAAAIESADVDVLDFEFAPSNVTVSPGATVRWTLRGQAPHTVTSDSFDSGMLKPGDVYEQTFNDTGEFAYRCDFHPEMTGTVTVAAIDAAPPTTDDGGAVAAGDDSGGGDGGGGATGADDAQAAESSGSASLLADSGFRWVPAFAFGLGVILLGWAALVTGRRRSVRTRATG